MDGSSITAILFFLKLKSTQLHRLQFIQNSMARAVTRTPRHRRITSILKSLHWLNSRKNPLLSYVTHLQFDATLPAHLPSRNFNHPAKTLYSILLLSNHISIPSRYLSQVLQLRHIHHRTTSLQSSAITFSVFHHH